MRTEILEKAWFVVLIWLAVNWILAFGMKMILPETDFAMPASIISAMVTGQIYASFRRAEMPKKLRLNACLIYFVVQVLLTVLIAVDLVETGALKEQRFLLYGIMISVTALLAAVNYFVMGSASRTTLKALEKKRIKQNKEMT